MKRIGLLAALLTTAALAVGAFAPGGAQAQTLELKFGHVGAPGSLFAASAEEFAKRANAKLAGKAKVVVFGASQLGKDKELLQKLKLGTVDFALPSTVMSSVVDEFGVFEMPYLVKNRDHMHRIENELFWSKLAPQVADKGYKIIAVWENGFRHITNNLRPIDQPEDLKGVKLRTPKGKWRVKMFQSYGANPTPMAFSEVFVALQTGVMDGQENPFAQIYSAKFHEVQKYLSLTGHVYTPAYVTVGAKKWASLPDDVRQALEDTAKEAQGFVYETAAKMEQDLLSKLQAGGMQVNEADKDAFIKASKGIYDEFKSSVPGGGELIDKAMSLAAQG
jgi:tripartite ATP-independent transporter DctP family solute receptor